ncbi:MAG: hypothetical protein HRS50_01660, partial [Mycoplasmataceae bacterium]|nr:hypothetical protein [Mycoplasmataceae bacterium]
LLRIEYNISSLYGISKNNFEKSKDELQVEVSKLRNNFENNTKKVDEKSYENAYNIRKKVNYLVEKTKGSAFEFFFLKETIMFLNRYKGSNEKYDQMLDSISESFNEEKYTESLRKAKEAIEIYGIK